MVTNTPGWERLQTIMLLIGSTVWLLHMTLPAAVIKKVSVARMRPTLTNGGDQLPDGGVAGGKRRAGRVD